MGLLRLKKDDNHKENTAGKIAKRRQKVYPCSDTDFGEVLFHYVMLATKKIRIFRVGFIAFANSKKTAFATPLFFGFEILGRTIFINCENFGRFHQSKLKKIKGKAKLSLARASLRDALD